MYSSRNFIANPIKLTGDKTKLTPLERIYIAFQADGSYPNGGKRDNDGSLCGHVTIRFNFTKKRKIDRLKSICDDGGFTYKISYTPSRKGACDFYIQLATYPSKTFDWVDFNEVNYEWGREFLEELSHWDSTIKGDNRQIYCTTVKDNIPKIQEICSISGYLCGYSHRQDNRKPHFSDVYSLSIQKDNRIGGQSVNKELIPYKGKVYCVTVPSGMILVRRNNKPLVCGNCGHAITTILKVLESLSKNFPVTINSKGYKVLDKHIRILQGDGISLTTIGEILEAMKVAGWSADNIVFGSGGKLLQDFTRDTFNFAIKCSYVEVDGKITNVEKSPMEFDSEGNYIQSFKKSKKGLLKLVKDSNGEFFTATSEDPLFDTYKDELVEVFRDGKILKEYTFEEVRKNSGL